MKEISLESIREALRASIVMQVMKELAIKGKGEELVSQIRNINGSMVFQIYCSEIESKRLRFLYSEEEIKKAIDFSLIEESKEFFRVSNEFSSLSDYVLLKIEEEKDKEEKAGIFTCIAKIGFDILKQDLHKNMEILGCYIITEL